MYVMIIYDNLSCVWYLIHGAIYRNLWNEMRGNLSGVINLILIISIYPNISLQSEKHPSLPGDYSYNLYILITNNV